MLSSSGTPNDPEKKLQKSNPPPPEYQMGRALKQS